MKDQEIRNALMTLIFAGFETAAAALSWATYWVYRSLKVREKLIEELISQPKSAEPMVIARLPYLGAVCQETLRINPPTMSAFSRTVNQPIEIDGYRLEPGTEIDASIYLAHRRESVYPEPDKFRPERFLERQFSPYEYLPFGGGQCRCLGASLAQYQMKLVLATILKEFRLKLVNPQSVKAVRHGIVMIPEGLKATLSLAR